MSQAEIQANNRNEEYPVVVYPPDVKTRHPYLLLKSMLSSISKSRELAWRLIIRDIRQRYRQSILGLLWVLMPPIVTTIIFVFLNERKIINIAETDIPYPVYVMIGSLLWQVFTESLLAPLKSFQSCIPIMIKINISPEAPIVSGMGQVMFYMGIQLIVALVVLTIFDINFSVGIFLAIVPIFMLVLLGTAIGLLLVPIGALLHDVAEIMNIVVRLWFFFTPIVYPPPENWPYSLVVNLNPVSPILISARDLMTKGTIDDPYSLVVIFTITIGALFVAWVLYRLSIPIIIERLGA